MIPEERQEQTPTPRAQLRSLITGQRSRGRTGRAGVPQGLRGMDGESRYPPGPLGDGRGEQVSPRAFGGQTGRAGVPPGPSGDGRGEQVSPQGLRGMDGESRCPPGPLGVPDPRPPPTQSSPASGPSSRVPSALCVSITSTASSLAAPGPPNHSPVFSSSWFSFLRFLHIYFAALTFRFQMLFNWYTEIPISFILFILFRWFHKGWIAVYSLSFLCQTVRTFCLVFRHNEHKPFT